MDKASHEELINLEREKLSKSMDQLGGGASDILFCVTQLRGILKHNEMIETNIKSRSKELELKEKELRTLSSDLDKKVQTFEKEKSEAGNLKKLVEECTEELKLKRNELTAKLETSSRIQREIESQWRQHSAEIQRLCSEETAKKKKELSMINQQIKESEKQFVMFNEQLEMKSSELASKEKDLGVVRESIELSNSELELKKKMVRSLNNEITVCAQKIDSKSKESGEIQKLIEKQTSELLVLEERHKEMLETICRSSSDMEKRVKAAETEASGFFARSERCKKEIEDKEKDLNLLKNQIVSEEKKLLQLKREIEQVTDIKKKDLELTLSKIEESGKKLESQRRQLEMQSVEQVSKQMEFEILGESSKGFITDLEMKEKRFQELNNLIKIFGEQLDLKSKELGEIERELKFKKRLRQMSTVLVKREKQQPISESTAEDTEEIDTFMLYGISASLTRHEISSFLRATPNRAEFVLELVQDEIKRGSTFLDTFLENLVLIFEELAKIQEDLAETQELVKSTQLQLQATEVATPWKEKTPKSSLEALAFLLFIMAYGLKTLMNEEETALLASSIVQYEQAPILFKYLSINRKFVEDLIKKSLYIPAVRLICLFKLDKEVSFSPSELLKKEIVNVRRSALENRSTELSSEAKERDGGRLRAILELVADYKLEIDLPGDLIAKVMVEGERSAPVAHWSGENVTSSSNPQAELKKKTVLVKHTGVKEENLGTTLPADVNPSNETFNRKHPPVINTYQRRRS